MLIGPTGFAVDTHTIQLEAEERFDKLSTTGRVNVTRVLIKEELINNYNIHNHN